jgi:hypothetical protein
MWIYSQASGTMYRDVTGKLVRLAKGYSGNGSSENNPDDQCKADHGPLPRGRYTFGQPAPFNNMLDCLRLIPDRSNEMCGRFGFWVHDGVSSGPHGETSEGCICLPHAARLNMYASMDHELQVVRDENNFVAVPLAEGMTASAIRLGKGQLLAATLDLPQGGMTQFGTLVKNGYFSSDPDNLSLPRAIRCNNAGALNISKWQTSRPGYVGYTGSDGSPGANHTTIYRTPEHGVAAWFRLLINTTDGYGYGFVTGHSFGVRELARHYAGQSAAQETVDRYVSAWTRLSQGNLTEDTKLDSSSTAQMIMLADALFWNEAGERSPLQEDQIRYGIDTERDGKLPP